MSVHSDLLQRVGTMTATQVIYYAMCWSRNVPESWALLRAWCDARGISYGQTPEESSDIDTDVETLIDVILDHVAAGGVL